MRTALDTNILSPIWTKGADAEVIADELLRACVEGPLVVSGIVFVELSAVPGLNAEIAEKTLRKGSIAIDFDLGEDVWRLAATSFSAYASRRRKSGGGLPKRLLADFLIAAHAALKADRLMTRDPSRYAADFPKLRLI